MSLFCLTLFFTIFFFWLIFCFLLSLPGFLIRVRSHRLNQNDVKKHLTICRCLFEKNLIDEKVYSFETNQVSQMYDHLVFKGYGFIVFPVIYALKKYSFLDKSVLFFVTKWVAVHEHFFNKSSLKTPKSHIYLVFICTSISRALGGSLKLIGL